MDEFWLQSSYVQPQYAPGPYIGSYLVRTSVVPVPAAVWLFGSGLIGLISIARRKSLSKTNFWPESPRLAVSESEGAAMGDGTWQDYYLKQVDENLIYLKKLKR